MLAARSLRVAAIRYVHPSHCIRPPSVRILSKLQPKFMGCISTPFVINYSKDAKTAETQVNFKNPQITPEPCDKTFPSITNPDKKDTKTKDEDCSTGAVTDVGIKLPSKDQVESFLFKSLVYFWDFAYYIFCLCRKLFETHVVKNDMVQTNWKQLLKRMDDARRDIKSK